MEEGDGEGGKSDCDGEKGGRATKRVRASRKRATKTKRKKGTATWVAGDEEGNGDGGRSNGDGNNADDDKDNKDDNDD